MEPGKEMRKGLVLGASGAIGKEVVKELIASNSFSKVTTIGRKIIDYGIPGGNPSASTSEIKGETKATSDSKVYNGCELHQVIVDYDHLDQYKEVFQNQDNIYCCLGTTRAAAGSPEAFKKVDYDYVVNSAVLAKESNIPHFSLVSSIGANANSSLLYPQTKGRAEEKIKALNFPRVSIFQPSVLKDRGNEQRFGETVTIALYPVFGWFLSNNYKPISVKTVAKAMVRNSLLDKTGQQVFTNEQIAELGKD